MKHTKLLLIAMSSVLALNAAADDGSNAGTSPLSKEDLTRAAAIGTGVGLATYGSIWAQKKLAQRQALQKVGDETLSLHELNGRVSNLSKTVFDVGTYPLATRMDQVTGLQQIRNGDLVELTLSLDETKSLDLIINRYKDKIRQRTSEIEAIEKSNSNLSLAEKRNLEQLRKDLHASQGDLLKIVKGEMEIGRLPYKEMIKVESPADLKQAIEVALRDGHQLKSIRVTPGQFTQMVEPYLKKLGRTPRLLGRGLVTGGLLVGAATLMEGASSQAEANTLNNNDGNRVKDLTIEPGKESRGQR